MKYLFKEELADYNSYKFPYLVYAQVEAGDDIDSLLDQGLLPTRMGPGMFYKTRSVRIDLTNFAHTSENRRIARKTEYLSLQEVPLAKISERTEDILALASVYYEKKFGKQIISAASLRKLLAGGIFTHVLVYEDQETKKTFGYTIVYRTAKSAYYAYPIYEPSYFEKNGGIGMMQAAGDYYKQLGLSWLYVGTAYTTAAKYKLQFEPMSWHSGNSWQTDLEALKSKLS